MEAVVAGATSSVQGNSSSEVSCTGQWLVPAAGSFPSALRCPPHPRQCSYGVIFWLLSGFPVSLVSTGFLSPILQFSWEFSEIPSVLSINSFSAQMMRQGWFLSHTAGNPN